jgi:hypothetical protein
MNLYRPFRNSEVEADLRVQLTADEMCEDVSLAGCEPMVKPAHGVVLCSDRAGLDVAGDSTRHRIEQHCSLDRFRQKIDSAAFHRANALGDIAMAGQKHDRQWVLHRHQQFLHIETALSREVEIEHDAAGIGR